jgi:hypothetical protein
MTGSKRASVRTLGATLALTIGAGLALLPASMSGAASRGPLVLPTLPEGTSAGAASAPALAPDAVTPDTTPIGGQLSEISAVAGGPNAAYGASVAISGSTAVVGALYQTANGNAEQGVVYVYAKSGSSWVQQAEFTSADGASYDSFGASVAISGSTIVVGAPNHMVQGVNDDGAAYVFTKSGTTWNQTAELTASDVSEANEFGSSVSVSGSTIAVGDPFRLVAGNYEGATYVFTKSGSTWSQKDELGSPADAIRDLYGFSVSVSGTSLVVGSPYRTEDSGFDTTQGAVDIYTLSSNGIGKLNAEVTNSDGATGDNFGASVATTGTDVLVGAPFHDSEAGGAYVFAKSGTTWAQQAELTFPAGSAAGWSVALSGSVAVVGAPGQQVGPNVHQGAAYVFAKSGTSWVGKGTATASNGAAGDELGVSVSVSGTTAIAGAPDHTIGSNADQGTAYLFES